MVKVSVVIPVYNVEEYLRDCLDSIVNQTLEDIEIICINDGSPDNSLEILREYEKNDDRITVIDQENGGHAVATNVGIEMAKGKYLFCMDSDDVLRPKALELTYNLAEKNDADFVIFKAINYDHENDKYFETENYSMNRVYHRVKDNVFSYEDVEDLIFTMSVTPWSKLYNRKFIMDNDIRYPEGLIFDDNVFFWKVLFSAKRICFLNEFLFERRWYSTSSTTAGDLRFIDSIEIYNLVWDVFSEFKVFRRHKRTLYNQKIFLAYMRFSKIKDEYKEDFFKAMKADFLRVFEDKRLIYDMNKLLSYRHKKIFEQVLLSDTAEDFMKCREIYNMVNSNSWKRTKFIRRTGNGLRQLR